MTIPHGMYIWQLSSIRNDYIRSLQKLNCKRVYLKVLDDASPGIFWSFQCNRQIVKQFTDAGIEVVGWGYIFDQKRIIDVEGIAQAVKTSLDMGCSGFVADIEVETENIATHPQVKELMTALRGVVPQGCLGYTSFGNPEDHPDVPWQILQDACDYQQPQMYYALWGFGSNRAEVEIAFAQHKRMGLDKKPIYPIWTTEPNGSKTTTPEELQWFLNAYPGSAVYEASCNPSWQVDYSNKFPGPKTPATWFDIQRTKDGATVVTAYASDTPVDQISSHWKGDVIEFFKKYDTAGTILVAPCDKPIPVLVKK